MPAVPQFVSALITLLAVASGATWYVALSQRVAGSWPLEFRSRDTVAWHPLVVLPVFALVPMLVAVLVRDWFQLLPLSERATSVPTLTDIQAMCATQSLSVVVVLAILCAAFHFRPDDFGLSPEWRRDLTAGAWGFLLALLPVGLLAMALHEFRKDDPHQVLQFLKAHPGTESVLWVILTAVVLAPLSEELLFRVVLQGMLEAVASPQLAIGAVAVAFVGVHQGVDVLPLLPLALILGYVYYRRRSFLAVFLLHALFNGFNLAMTLAGSEI